MILFKKLGEDLGSIEALTEAQLKKSFKNLAIKHHPDKNANTNESIELMKLINEAHDNLIKLFKQK